MPLPLHPHEIAGPTVCRRPRRSLAQNPATTILGLVVPPIRPTWEAGGASSGKADDGA